MFQFLQRKETPPKFAPDPEEFSLQQLVADSTTPISIKAVTTLPEAARQRLARILLPPELLRQFEIRPMNWKGPDGDGHVCVVAEPDAGLLRVEARHAAGARDPFLSLELQDNRLNGIDLNLLVLSDPLSQRFAIDVDEQGQPTQFGTLRRNLQAEEQAMEAGLAPGQVRTGLQASQRVLQQVDTFLAMITHYAYFLEPLTYASAWVFERRGFAYVRGHKLMDDIQREFQPGGELHRALDDSTPFRRPQQWRTVRGRAWAIHDGILDYIDATWNGVRMVKQVGQHAGVDTFPDAHY
ncbi:MAG TPA: hypothetical protein VK879_17575 [Candidatus Sulfomarinibacteraceae bacterium]|nr:hypothetical protein [Candidatus Sulfomarinibacteraceae bacterium]